MKENPEKNWKSIIGLVAELKRCDECNIPTASVAMAFICIDTFANLSRPADKKKVTRKDFKEWVDLHLKGHPDQPYNYRGKDVYAARCALLHKYSAKAELHIEDPETIMFVYHDGRRHQYNPSINKNLAIIGTKSFINDVINAIDSFLELCQKDSELRLRVEGRLADVFQTMPYPSK